MEDILGDEFVNKDFENVKMDFKDKKLLYGIYFSASWCRPC
jgi:hypothetical protein